MWFCAHQAKVPMKDNELEFLWNDCFIFREMQSGPSILLLKNHNRKKKFEPSTEKQTKLTKLSTVMFIFSIYWLKTENQAKFQPTSRGLHWNSDSRNLNWSLPKELNIFSEKSCLCFPANCVAVSISMICACMKKIDSKRWAIILFFNAVSLRKSTDNRR